MVENPIQKWNNNKCKCVCKITISITKAKKIILRILAYMLVCMIELVRLVNI